MSKILGWALPCLICTIRQPDDYVPDFLIHLWGQPRVRLSLETKGYDPLTHVKAQAAQRWVAAVNAEGRMGAGITPLLTSSEEIRWHIEETVARMRKEETAVAEIT